MRSGSLVSALVFLSFGLACAGSDLPMPSPPADPAPPATVGVPAPASAPVEGAPVAAGSL